MGMSYAVYVGPFLKCEGGKNVELDVVTNDELTYGRGEFASDDGDISYVIPNRDVTGIDRQMSFDRHDDSPVVFGINSAEEGFKFAEDFGEEIAELKKHFNSVLIEWGVVPYFG